MTSSKGIRYGVVTARKRMSRRIKIFQTVFIRELGFKMNLGITFLVIWSSSKLKFYSLLLSSSSSEEE